MKTSEILEKLSKGAVLCMGYDEDGEHYWLEPSRVTVRTDVAEQLITVLEPGGDRLFKDFASQTWRAKK